MTIITRGVAAVVVIAFTLICAVTAGAQNLAGGAGHSLHSRLAPVRSTEAVRYPFNDWCEHNRYHQPAEEYELCPIGNR